jgi:hypothetical protein
VGKGRKGLGLLDLAWVIRIKWGWGFFFKFRKTISSRSRIFPLTEIFRKIFQAVYSVYVFRRDVRDGSGGLEADALNTNGYPPSSILKCQAVTLGRSGMFGIAPQRNCPSSNASISLRSGKATCQTALLPPQPCR